ncbi:MAG: hypothetical protein ACW99A_15445 [Candidatus Kariarchaeaceae archaeon]|jgi:hypothetical protein
MLTNIDSGIDSGLFEDNRNNRSKYGERLDPGIFEYLGYLKTFTKMDWIKYIAWIGMMFSLAVATMSFLLIGNANGAYFPIYVWLIPVATIGFTLVISLDNIAHSAIYKDWISESEVTIHKFTTASGIASNVSLVLGYAYSDLFYIPIIIFLALSIIYSLIDEVIHWIRYSKGGSGIVEVTCHFYILVFHPIMVFAWFKWYLDGYQGVAETLSAMGF